MFLNEEAYKKNSLFGTFEKQIKRSQLKQKDEPFQVVNYLKFSENDVNWYYDLTDKLIEKEQKLKSWKKNAGPTQPPPRPRLASSASRASPFSGRASNDGDAVEVDRAQPVVATQEETDASKFVYAPRSPSPTTSQAKQPEATKMPERKPTPTTKPAFNQQPTEPQTKPALPGASRQPPSEPKVKTSPVKKQPEPGPNSPDAMMETSEDVKEPSKAAEDSKPGIFETSSHDEPSVSDANSRPNQTTNNQPRAPRGRPPFGSERPDIAYPWQNVKKAVNTMKNWYPLKFKLAYPFPSQLNSAEQLDYMDLHKRFTAIQMQNQGQQTIQLEGKQARLYRKYMHYKNLLNKEYFNFEKFSKAYYRRALYDDYSKLDANVEKYMKELCGFLHDNIKANYQALYRQVDQFSLTDRSQKQQQQPLEPTANLKFESNLIRLGNVNKIIFPNVTMDRQAPVTLSYLEVSRRTSVYDHVVQDGVKKRTDKVYFIKPLLHADTNIEKLALKYRANIVMSNSSFVNLMFELSASVSGESKPFDPKVYNESEEYAQDEFRAPLIVKTLRSADGKESHRCLFFEKPLVPTRMSKREINEKYYKRALLATFIKTVSSQQNQEAVLALRKAQQSTASQDAYAKMATEVDNYVDHDLLSNLEASIERGRTASSSIQTILAAAAAPPLASLNLADQATTSKESFMLSEDSLDSETVAKKLKIDVEPEDEHPNDDDDGSDDEDQKLMIVDPTHSKEQATDDLETPASPPSEALIPASEIASPENHGAAATADEPSGGVGHYNLRRNRRNATFEEPKVIPLDKVDKQPGSVESTAEDKSAKKATATTSESTGKKEAAATSGSSLFEMIYQMQEKLTSAQASVMQDSSHFTQVPSFHQPPAARTLFNYVNKTQLNEMAENPKDYTYVPNKHENVSYSLWTLNTNPPIRILVRSSNDGYINDETSSHNKVVIYPKLEYQPQFGCERLSKRDYCRMWCKSFLRLGCNVVLCRINVFMNKIGSISNVKNNEILSPDCSFNPQQALNQMRDLFKKCLNLKENSYLLEKCDLKTFSILESVSPDKHPSFDLCQYYSFPSRWDKTPLWLPIDPALYLPYHNTLGRIPSTFEPEVVKTPTNSQNSQQDLDQSGGGGQGKKKRKRPNNSYKARKNM